MSAALPFRALPRRAAQAALTLALLALVIVLGQLPMGRPSGEAIVRLALRTVEGRIEVCRETTAEERAALPEHMRRDRVCERTPVVYRLRVALDGETRLDERVEPRGLRRDRPHIVDRQIVAPPGRTRLEVSLEPQPEAGAGISAPLAEVPGYSLDRELVLEADRIALVLLDEAAGRLLIYDAP